MSDTKISALTALTGANVDTAADNFPIEDHSATTTKKILVDELRIALLSNTALTNSLAADVALTNIASYFTGPTVAQGTTGIWFAFGAVTVQDTNTGGGNISVKLWDGTTVIASGYTVTGAAGIQGNSTHVVHLSGYISAPAGNIRISVKNSSNTSNTNIIFNASGNSKDSTLSVFRIG